MTLGDHLRIFPLFANASKPEPRTEHWGMTISVVEKLLVNERFVYIHIWCILKHTYYLPR